MPYHSPPVFRRCPPLENVAVSEICNVSDVLSCGVVYSCPSGEKPVIEITLKPTSRGFDVNAGRPTVVLLVAVFSPKTPNDTRLYPNRRKFTILEEGEGGDVSTPYFPSP